MRHSEEDTETAETNTVKQGVWLTGAEKTMSVSDETTRDAGNIRFVKSSTCLFFSRKMNTRGGQLCDSEKTIQWHSYTDTSQHLASRIVSVLYV